MIVKARTHTTTSKKLVLKKIKNPAIIKLTDTMYLRNIDIKREWMYAELVIQITTHPYLGKWEYKDAALSVILGDEMLENLIIPIKKKKRDWDKAFWDTAGMFWNSAYDTKNKDLNKIWDETNVIAKKRQVDKVSSKEEKAEESRILQRSW